MANLPTRHLSVRVPWHDTAWDARVCKSPAANHACMVLPNVCDNRNTVRETEDAGRAWSELEAGNLPPCIVERGGFLRTHTLHHVRSHRYARRGSPTHGQLKETALVMPAYSVMATPFRWMRRDEAATLTQLWGLNYEDRLEERADEPLTGTWRPDWVQDHRNQHTLLDGFFSSVVREVLLVFFYAKDLPLVEREDGGQQC